MAEGERESIQPAWPVQRFRTGLAIRVYGWTDWCPNLKQNEVKSVWAASRHKGVNWFERRHTNTAAKA